MRMLHCFITGFIASFVISSLLSVAIAGTPKAVWPRLAGTKIGTPHAYGDPTMQAQLAKLDYLVIDFFPNWGSTDKMRAALKGIKEKNQDIIILDYVMQETVINTWPALQPLRDKLDAEKWWLYQKGGAGAKVDSGFGNAFTTNFANSVPKDANGERWNTWFAKYVHKQMWSQIPELDGTYTDNVFWKPRVNGDWNRDGITDSQDNTAIYPEFRTGMMEHLNQIRALMPGKLVTGNIGDWGRPEATVPEFAGQIDGGLLERYIGETWSNEGVDQNGVFNGRGSWSRMMGAYHKVMGLAACRTKGERYSVGAGAEHDHRGSNGHGCGRDGEMMMIGSIPTRFSTLQHRHPTDVPRHRHQRPLPAYGFKPPQQKLPEPHPRLMMPKTGSTVCLRFPYNARPARVFSRCRMRSTVSAGSQSGGGSLKRSCQGR